MNNLIVGFSKAKSRTAFVSHLIRLFQKTPFSHTYLTFYSQKYDRWLVYQASKTAVNFMEYNHFLENNIIVDEFNIPITEEQHKSAITYAIDTVGRPYSLKALIGFAFELFGYKPKWLLDNGEKAFICSELVVRTLEVSDIITYFENPDYVTPKELYEYLKNKY